MRAQQRPAGCVSLSEMFAGRPCERAAQSHGLFWEQESAARLFQLVEGVGRAVRVSSEGRREVIAFAFPGDVVGSSARDRYPFTFEAVTAVRFRSISRELLQRWIEDVPSMAAALVDQLREEVSAAQSRAHVLSEAGADFRMANFLLSVARRTEGAVTGKNEFSLPMPRVDIGDHLGLTMETVCRTMTKFTRRGIIVTRGPHRIRIRNATWLLQVAREESTERRSPPLRLCQFVPPPAQPGRQAQVLSVGRAGTKY